MVELNYEICLECPFNSSQIIFDDKSCRSDDNRSSNQTIVQL